MFRADFQQVSHCAARPRQPVSVVGNDVGETPRCDSGLHTVPLGAVAGNAGSYFREDLDNVHALASGVGFTLALLFREG